MDNGDSTNLLGAALEEGGIPVVWSGGRGGVAADALSEPSRRGLVVPGSLYPPRGRPKLTRSLYQNACCIFSAR